MTEEEKEKQFVDNVNKVLEHISILEPKQIFKKYIELLLDIKHNKEKKMR